MKRRSAPPFRMAPLQRLTVRPIEDPAEQAALDNLLKRREATAANGSPSDSKGFKATSKAQGKKGKHELGGRR